MTLACPRRSVGTRDSYAVDLRSPRSYAPAWMISPRSHAPAWVIPSRSHAPAWEREKACGELSSFPRWGSF